MKALTREDVLGLLQAPRALPREPVPVPEWGGQVWVGTLSSAGHDVYVDVLRGLGPTPGLARAGAALVVAATTDESGARLFTADDVEALVAESHQVLDRLVTVAARLNGLDVPSEGTP